MKKFFGVAAFLVTMWFVVFGFQYGASLLLDFPLTPGHYQVVWAGGGRSILEKTDEYHPPNHRFAVGVDLSCFRGGIIVIAADEKFYGHPPKGCNRQKHKEIIELLGQGL